MDEGSQRIYELGFLLTPLLTPEDAVALVAGKLVKTLENRGGALTAEWPTQLIALAYPIGKVLNHKRDYYREAHFGAIRFSLAPEKLVELESEIRDWPELIRFITLSGLSPQMVIPKVEVLEPESTETETESSPVVVRTEAKPIMSEAEIDKEIDSLLAKVD